MSKLGYYFFLLSSIWVLTPVWGESLTPQAVVLEYYHALQNRDFAQAYRYISQVMRAGKDQDKWAQEIQALFERGKVAIKEISVSPGAVSDQEARVNSTITSKDLVNVNGLIEYNREYLVLEDGSWKLDRTELRDSKILDPNN